ncbi:MAG: tetratricopeptide repeat protein [Betaproteobacteria bacterium]|nr:tetratricopeptide repeat protein [Betaproteobacteria bacterium]
MAHQLGDRESAAAGYCKVIEFDASLPKAHNNLGIVPQELSRADEAIACYRRALGAPAWILLSAPSDWRWLIWRDGGLWCPSVRPFRQSSPGQWGPVIGSVQEALAARFEDRRS